jgi:hypothetical protein
MSGSTEGALNQQRSMEVALAHLLTEYQRQPCPLLARTIELLQDELKKPTQ